MSLMSQGGTLQAGAGNKFHVAETLSALRCFVPFCLFVGGKKEFWDYVCLCLFKLCKYTSACTCICAYVFIFIYASIKNANMKVVTICASACVFSS